MLKEDIREPATTEWASSIVIASKKDDLRRFRDDYQNLNEVTVREIHPIPRMDEWIDSMEEARIFSTLEATYGYWKVQIDRRDHKRSPLPVTTAYTSLYECRLDWKMRLPPFNEQWTVFCPPWSGSWVLSTYTVSSSFQKPANNISTIFNVYWRYCEIPT